MINAQTKLFAVIGQPLGHSLSPVLHNTFFAQQYINGIYLALPVEKDYLAEAVQGLYALGVGGVNVTIPYKEAIIPHLVGLTPRAEICQAVNTLIPTTKGFIGDNTDGAGLLAALLEEHQWQPEGKQILLIGAGGAAKGIAIAMAMGGAERILVANRHQERASQLAAWVSQQTMVKTEALSLTQLHNASLYEEIDALINTTSLGMEPLVTAMPPVATTYLSQKHLVVDVIYNPLETMLLKKARLMGALTSSGLGMFIHQGALAFEKWLGIQPHTQPLYHMLTNILDKNEKDEVND